MEEVLNDKWVGIEGVANYLGVNKDSVRNWIKKPDFLFLNRSDFNGMIRFNRHGQFNVPFCQKPNRFAKAYVTKIYNQVANVASIMKGKDWTFRCCPWQEAFDGATENGQCELLLTHSDFFS